MKPLIIAIIGGIATGKSSVIHFFREKGFSVIQADLVAHQFLDPKSPTYSQIVGRFGRDVLDSGGNIVRARLAKKLFRNSQKREWLNSLIHPLVYEKISMMINSFKQESKNDIVLEIPLLTSENRLLEIDKVILVTSPIELQKARLKEKKLSDDEIEQRIKAQVPLKEQLIIADYIINNDGSNKKLQESLNNLWEIFQTEWM